MRSGTLPFRPDWWPTVALILSPVENTPAGFMATEGGLGKGLGAAAARRAWLRMSPLVPVSVHPRFPRPILVCPNHYGVRLLKLVPMLAELATACHYVRSYDFWVRFLIDSAGFAADRQTAR